MSKSQSSYHWYAFFLASILLNILLVSNIYMSEDGGAKASNKLTWTLDAAAEAEAVAAISCSGHGNAYVDGVLNDEGKPVCECNPCFSGSDCSQFDHNCVADATSGDPIFLEPFWEKHAASSAIVTSGWHRMSYSYHYGNSSVVSQQLENHIRKLHSTVKNANTEGKYLLLGVGSTQLLNAAVYALSMTNISSTAKVVASAPYYPVYRDQTNFFETAHYKFEGDASLLKNTTSNMDNVIEFVTSPNNPDGQLKEAILQGPFVSTIYDHAYYWPHFSAIPGPVDADIMLFTLSKLTGHAGTRLGWAFVKDPKIYELMSYYVGYGEMSVSKDTQLRALKLLKVILAEGKERDIFNFAYETMKARWQELSEIISLSNRFTLQEIPSQYCTFFENVRGPSPAYAWLRCEMVEDVDCYTVLEAAKIIGRKGNRYGSVDRYLRLSLLKSQDEFDVLLQRLKELVFMEGTKATL